LEPTGGRIMNRGERIKMLRSIGTYVLFCTFGFLLPSLPGFAQTAPTAAGAQPSSAPRDGQHDFDFNLGTWKTHIRRLVQPLTGSTTWVDLNGTVVVKKVWDGRAQLEEIEADGSTGHFEGLTLFLYNPEAHQWNMNFSTSSDGAFSTPSVGEFKNGRGEFYDQEPFNGRMILVRNVWMDMTANSCRFEQAFSDDGGKTWETNWIAVDTRVK
jgi:hypothetical protein